MNQSAKGPKHGILSLNIKDKAVLYAAYMPFVKEGGLFVATSGDHPLGTPVQLQLELMDEAEVFNIEGDGEKK